MQDHSTDSIEAINRTFTPEFRNRLDAVVPFGPLGEDVILTVVDKFLTELQGQLDERQVVIEVDEEARLWLVEKGYDATMGRETDGARNTGAHQKAPCRYGVVRRISQGWCCSNIGQCRSL